MADLSYEVAVNTSQAERNLANLQKSVAGINNAFAGLKGVLAGISLAGVITQSIQLADAIQDISDASGFAIDKILGFTRAVIDNGGSAETAHKSILKLVGSIGDAASGSGEMQNSFAQVGVSLNDLRTLSEQDILSKTIQGLASINDVSQRSALSAKLLGKEFRNIGIAGLAGSFGQATLESARYASAIQSAAAAQGAIDKELVNFKIAILDALKPITDLVKQVNIGIDGFRKFIQAVLAVGAVLATVFVGGKIIAGIRIFYAALLAVAGSAKNLYELIRNLYTGFGSLVRATEGGGGAFRRIWLVIKAIIVAMSELLAPAFAALKTIALPVLASVAAYWGYIQDSTTSALTTLKEYYRAAMALVGIDVGSTDPREGMRGRGDPAEIATREKEAASIREVTDALAKRRAEIAKASIAFKEQNNLIIDNINLEKSFIGKTEDVIEVERAREEVLRRAAAESEKLREARNALGKDEQALAGVYDQQIAQISKLAQTDADRIARGVEGLQGLRMVEAARLKDIENTTKALEDQYDRQQQLNGILAEAGQKVLEIGNRVSATQTVGLSSIQRQILDIQEKTRGAALEAGRNFADAFGDVDTPERAQEFAAGLDRIAAAYRVVGQAEIDYANQTYKVQREWSTGWEDSFAQYKEDAFNAASAAQTYFERFSKGFEDAIVSALTKGKFSFKEFANSLIADFARIEARKMFSWLFGGSGSTSEGSVLMKAFTWGKSLFGMSNGGALDGSSPVVVGERGPELFVPSSAGRIIANNQIATQAAAPAPVTVHYNIQAVDASSFRSLVARDPSFIYAVTEKGRQSQPSRRM